MLEIFLVVWRTSTEAIRSFLMCHIVMIQGYHKMIFLEMPVFLTTCEKNLYVVMG